ncbi:hypothetical protein [Roseovarius amoyensis]|uniref:hypothetical protein n=1 Tax=Roseovarius amoyensis TaxID=2211448 RepID=UPI0013A6B284|nr:hypothetical protein [Roseovarius amoyensis]
MHKGMFELDLHLGVHKTATTFLQAALYSNKRILTESGICVPHHRQTRKHLTNPCQRRVDELRESSKLGERFAPGLERRVSDFFDELRNDSVSKILLTDENFVGHCGHVVHSGKLYSRREVFLRMLKDLLPESPRHIYLSFRQYDQFFSSVYFQYLLDVTPRRFVPPETFAQRVLERRPSWTHFIACIRNTFSDSQIVVWSYEGAQKDWHLVLDAMLGSKVSSKLDLRIGDGDPHIRRSMSGKAFHTFLQKYQRDGAQNALSCLGEIRARFDGDQSLGKATIFSADEVMHLERLYGRHLNELRHKLKDVRRLC